MPEQSPGGIYPGLPPREIVTGLLDVVPGEIRGRDRLRSRSVSVGLPCGGRKTNPVNPTQLGSDEVRAPGLTAPRAPPVPGESRLPPQPLLELADRSLVGRGREGAESGQRVVPRMQPCNLGHCLVGLPARGLAGRVLTLLAAACGGGYHRRAMPGPRARGAPQTGCSVEQNNGTARATDSATTNPTDSRTRSRAAILGFIASRTQARSANKAALIPAVVCVCVWPFGKAFARESPRKPDPASPNPPASKPRPRLVRIRSVGTVSGRWGTCGHILVTPHGVCRAICFEADGRRACARRDGRPDTRPEAHERPRPWGAARNRGPGGKAAAVRAFRRKKGLGQRCWLTAPQSLV